MLFIGYFVFFFINRCPDVLMGWPKNASKNVFNTSEKQLLSSWKMCESITNLIGENNFEDKCFKAPH